MKFAKSAILVIMFASLVAVIGSTRLEAHKGHDHMLMGTLTMVASDHVMVKVTDPKTKKDSVKTVAMKPETKVLRGVPGTPAKAADLTTGTRVIVNIGEGKEPLSAKEIHITDAPAHATK